MIIARNRNVTGVLTQQHKIKIEVPKLPEKPLPSKLQMARSAVSTIAEVSKGLLQGKGLKVSDEVLTHRKSICASCEFFRESDQRCSKCGCYLSSKTYLKASTCPMGKW